MTQEQSFRAAMQTPLSLQRFAVVFTLMMLLAFRRDLLGAIGYADTGTAHWISTGAMASAFMVYVLLSTRDPWQAVAEQSPIFRFGYAAFYLVTAGAFLLLAFAGEFTNPFFWVAAAVMLVMTILEWRAKRKQARV